METDGRRGSERQTTATPVLWTLGVILIVILAFEGHRLEHLLPVVEHRIEALGAWGPVIFVAALIALEPFFFPNTLFGITAGVVFGLWKGYALYFAAIYIANLIIYWIGRVALRRPVLRALDSRPQIRGAVEAASRGGSRLVFWIRLLPLNPAIFSYAFGAVQVPFRSVLLGTLGMFPHLFLDVYLGGVAAHVTTMAGQGHANWEAKGVGFVLGLVAIGAVSWQITKIARAQIGAAGVGEAP